MSNNLLWVQHFPSPFTSSLSLILQWLMRFPHYSTNLLSLLLLRFSLDLKALPILRRWEPVSRISHSPHQNPPWTHAHFSCLKSSFKCLRPSQTQVLHLWILSLPTVSKALCLQSSSRRPASPSFPSFLDDSPYNEHISILQNLPCQK